MEGCGTDVKWCQVYKKEKRLIVDLHMKQSMLTVTGSDCEVVPGGECIDASDLD